MGYRSNVTIAIKKEVLMADLVDPKIPDVLKKLGYQTKEDHPHVYFVIEDWKWYESFPEILDIKAWFASMEENEFGAIRIGENDDDVQSWGSPWLFDIYVVREIDHPFKNREPEEV